MSFLAMKLPLPIFKDDHIKKSSISFFPAVRGVPERQQQHRGKDRVNGDDHCWGRYPR
jgi:hypothetical protein